VGQGGEGGGGILREGGRERGGVGGVVSLEEESRGEGERGIEGGRGWGRGRGRGRGRGGGGRQGLWIVGWFGVCGWGGGGERAL
jgi:hypothetical protein